MRTPIPTLLLLLALLMVACTSADPEVALEAVEVAQVEPTATTAPLPTEAPTSPPPTDVPIEAAVAVEEDADVAAEPEATEEPVAEPTAAATNVPEPTAAPSLSPLETTGRTADGAFFIGSESAELEIIDYSDFL